MRPALLILLAPAALVVAAAWTEYAAEPAKAPASGTIHIHVDAM